MNSIENSSIFDELNVWIDSYANQGAIAVVCGKNGDMDTIGSAIALASIHPNMMACGLHMNRLAKRLATDLDAPFRTLSEQNTTWPNSISAVIVVDAAAENQTGLSLPNVPKCIIDHHATNDWEIHQGDLLCQIDARSTTQIIFEFLEQYHHLSLSIPVCKLLIAGLVTDTGRFKFADHGAFSAMDRILKHANIDVQEFFEYIEQDDLTVSEQGVLLRGLNRTKIEQAGQWSLAMTRASTQESKIATMLRGLQTDVVLITRHRNGETRLTGRAQRNAVLEGVKLGSLMEEVAGRLGGEGGGHDGAAGWTGPCDPIAAETAFLDVLARVQRR
jgi:nanoRNase/pAp phosphatase (c-di-AMP/oligoRNAs hydrolase)